jgi:hypothetical protein
MTKQEAVNVLDQFRKAFMTLGTIEGRNAFRVLIDDSVGATMAGERAAEAGRALDTLQRAFAEIDRKGIRFPSN